MKTVPSANKAVSLFAVLIVVFWLLGVLLLVVFVGATLNTEEPLSKAALIGDASNAITGLISTVALVFVVIQVIQNNKMILDNQNALSDQLKEQVESKEQFKRLATAQEDANGIELRSNIGTYIKTFIENEKLFLEMNLGSANYNTASGDLVRADNFIALNNITQIRLSQLMTLYQNQHELRFDAAVEKVSNVIKSNPYPL